VRISLNIQYVVNPSNFPQPRARKQSGNILAFGLRISVNIAGLMGMLTMK
jgi:porin